MSVQDKSGSEFLQNPAGADYAEPFIDFPYRRFVVRSIELFR